MDKTDYYSWLIVEVGALVALAITVFGPPLKETLSCVSHPRSANFLAFIALAPNCVITGPNKMPILLQGQTGARPDGS